MIPFRSLVPFLALTAGALAQATHTQLFPAVSPSARAGLHGVSDGSGMLVFGGLLSSAPSFSNEMWRFDGVTWTNLTPAGANPAARDWYASAWDAARSRYVLFGGRGFLSGTTRGDFGDTWEFDGTTWTQMTPALSPSARRWSAMTYDATLGKCVLFGGSTSGTTFLGDTWTWDGATWTQLTPATSPSPRARGWLEWDLMRNRAIYALGKNTTAATALSETWSWDGSTWALVPATTIPGWNAGNGLIAYGMTYDLLRDRMVLVGGTRTTATVSPQTWEHDGNDWALWTQGALTGRTGPAVAFVAGLGKTFVFGGSSGVNPMADTWEYQTNAFAVAQPFGVGCAGGAGVVQLTTTNAAWTGETAVTTASSLDPAGLALGVLGLSNTTWAGGALPFPLSAVLATTSPSCQLLVSPDALVFLPAMGGVADLTIAIPANASLLGAQLHEQVTQFDAAFVFSVSGGVSLTIGAK
jgi:hypothetical protein